MLEKSSQAIYPSSTSVEKKRKVCIYACVEHDIVLLLPRSLGKLQTWRIGNRNANEGAFPSITVQHVLRVGYFHVCNYDRFVFFLSIDVLCVNYLAFFFFGRNVTFKIWQVFGIIL